MLKRLYPLPAVFCALIIAVFSAVQTAHAEKITLKLINGALIIKGDLLSFNGSFYVVKSTDFGMITVDAKKFVCTSQICPSGPVQKTAKPKRKRIISNDFAIHGSNTIGAQLMPAIIEGYAKTIQAKTTRIVGSGPEEIKLVLSGEDGKKLVSIDLKSKGSGTSAPALASGTAQIGMSSRPIKTSEIQKLKEAGINGVKSSRGENIVALDGLIVLVSPSNPIHTLSMEQLAQIFSGQLTDWSQIGRPTPGPINVYARDSKSGTFDTFKSLVLKPYKVKISPKAKRFTSNADLSDQTANDPDGIGFAGFAYKRNASLISITSKCGITKQPTLFNVKTEEYPLSRRLFLYTSSEVLTSQHAKKVLDYALSDAAQPIIPRLGFINQSIHTLSFDKQGSRIAAALNVTGDDFNLDLVRDFTKQFSRANRLSVTFRFKSGSAQLTNKSQSDILRFVKLLKTDAMKKKEVFLVGFSDDRGAFELNRELAFKRALAIKFAILSASSGAVPSENLKLKSYGELFPVACNTDKKGQERNRRVEVWVR